MKKVLFVIVSAIVMAFVSVSCDKFEDDGNRAVMCVGTIYDDRFIDDTGVIVSLVNNKYPNKTRGYFAIYYNEANIVVDEKGKMTISNATAVMYDRYVLFNPESLSEAEGKGIDVSKLEGYDEHLYCSVSGGYLQLSGYDRYANDSLYHVVYDVNKQQDDTLRLTLCNTDKAQLRTRLMHVEFDLEPVQAIAPWKDSLVVALQPAVGKRILVKIAKKDLQKPHLRR